MDDLDTCFSDTLRIKNKPFSKRVGVDLLTRTKNGHVALSVGYFTKSQILSRKKMSEIMGKEIKDKSHFYKLLNT